MPSGAKRRKAAKKKKETTQTAISNGNGEVKVVESDGGENSTPASQDFEPQQNPFTKDEEKQPSVGNEAVEYQKDGSLSDLNGHGKVVGNEAVENQKDGSLSDSNGHGKVVGNEAAENQKDGSLSDSNGHGKVVEISGEAKSQNGGKAGVDGPQDSNGKLNGEREPEINEEQSNVVGETESFGQEVVQVESNGFVTEKAVQVQSPESAPAESKSETNEEKVHPSETFSDFQETGAERLPSSNTKLGETSEETSGRPLQQSDVHITNSVWHAGSSDAQQSAEKEPLLRPTPRPADKTSWTGCCGLLELFTGSSR